MKNIYGKIRGEDLPLLESVVQIFKKRGLKGGLHGTSLWNRNYKDVDLLVVSGSSASGVESFLMALDDLKNKHSAKILKEKGNELIGLDYEVEIGKMILHLSYVVLL